MWEFMFPGVDKPQLLIPEAEEDNFDNLDDDEVVVFVWKQTYL